MKSILNFWPFQVFCDPILEAECVRLSGYSAVFRYLYVFGMMPQDMLLFQLSLSMKCSLTG